MTTTATTNPIRAALRSMAAADGADWPDAAADLLAALGYRSERTLAGQSGDAGDFIRQFPAANPGAQAERALLDAAQSVHILFQYTASEIQAQTQRALFDAAGFDTGNARSFLFAAVQLRGDAYPRGRYAAFTRELNRHIQLPMVVLFRTLAGRVTLAFVHRRPNRRDETRDVLGSVSLIREIDAADPHRAHLDILAELSLDARLKWLDQHGKPHNFDGLLDAWLDALDTEELNRRFYRELFDWFRWAVDAARFPTDQRVTVSAEEHVIRLITRLLFVWFIKEKGLVAEELFVENLVGQLLQDYDADAGDSYYRAVLQNLFFATLNTEIAERGFSAERDSTHRLFSRYRYRKEMGDPDALLALFAKTPFINGGLFDCLDSEEATGRGGYRIDCFTDNPRQRAGYSIPNRLFFGQDAGGANPGLVTLFNRYKFTVEENTPAEREVALDPELLGKVFENLLAAFNPETRENARKQTGSYYTPRAVVDYMVDEALKAYLHQKVAQAFLPVNTQTGMSAPPGEPPDVAMSRRRLPHWTMEGAIYWITFRLADAIPRAMVNQLRQEREEWEQRNPKPWSPEQWQTWDDRFGERLEEWLNAGYGSRALAQPEIRQVVIDALLRFDGDRHRLHGAVIMPTHVHLLIEPLPGHSLSGLMRGIKGASARAANQIRGARGTFWLEESYDRIVRSEAEYLRFQQYIADNPIKAGLDDNEYWLYQSIPTGEADIPVRPDPGPGSVADIPGGADIPVRTVPSPNPGSVADRNVCPTNDTASGSASTTGGADISVRTSGAADRNVCPTNPITFSDKIDRLFDYEYAFEDADAETLFTDPERAAIVRAIAEIKVLDPAVGSGAFPMGVLHKLTLALRRLDPRNELWESLQKELAGQRAASAFDTADQSERDAELREISATFQRYRDTDFGRKLYLIQNGIYGVDIQPIATQIAKLRFFISLAIDQEPALAGPDNPDAAADAPPDAAADNYGIKPLPNLETRFVAANTLLGIGQPAQPALTQANNVAELHGWIRANRERHFHATTRRRKQQYRQRDRDLRRELAAALRESGFAADSARQLADWDPYDQNASANWFDAEYMFGVRDGFDVVIGNPPYVQLQKERGKLARLYQDAGFATFARTGDIYQLFCEQGCRLLTPDTGLLAYITSNSWLKAEYGKSTRRYFAESQTPLQLIEMGKDVFENVIVDSCILIARAGRHDAIAKAVDLDKLAEPEFPPDESLWGALRPDGESPWSVLTPAERSAMDKMLATGTPLRDWDVNLYRGFTTGCNEAFIIDSDTRRDLISSDAKSAEIIKPVLRGRDIRRYHATTTGLHLIDTHNGYGEVAAVNVDDYPAIKTHLDEFYPQLEKRQDKGRTPYNLRNCTYHAEFAKAKLLWMDMSPEGRFAYCADEVYCNNKGFVLTGNSLKYLCGVLNSRLVTWFMGNTARTTGMGLMQWEKFAVERIPIPKISAAKQRPLVRLVDRILTAKSANASADTSELEAEINRRVYALYGLTDEEVAAVSGRVV